MVIKFSFFVYQNKTKCRVQVAEYNVFRNIDTYLHKTNNYILLLFYNYKYNYCVKAVTNVYYEVINANGLKVMLCVCIR